MGYHGDMNDYHEELVRAQARGHLDQHDWDGDCLECGEDNSHPAHAFGAVDGVDKNGVWVAHAFEPPDHDDATEDDEQ
jgi:hypothetical protein